MAIDTIEKELELINNAIEAIISGAQSYNVNGQSVTRASLKDLLDRKNYLESRLSARRRGGVFVKVPVFKN